MAYAGYHSSWLGVTFPIGPNVWKLEGVSRQAQPLQLVSLRDQSLALFSFYYLPEFSQNITSILYADDTTLSFRGTSLPDIINKCNQKLNFFNSWSISNRLTINTEKTYFMTFSNNQLPTTIPNLIISNNSIISKNSDKFLGVVLDERLRFDDHISMLCRKVSKSLGILYKLRDYLPLTSLISLYYTFIYPYFTYCNLVWGNTFITHLNPLIILQKKAIRIINKADYNAHTENLFFNNKILKLIDINFYLQAIHMYKSDKTDYQSSHFHNTRHRTDLIPTFQRTVKTQRSLSYSAPRIWNQIPTDIKNSTTLNMFKRRLKSHLVGKYEFSSWCSGFILTLMHPKVPRK